MKKDIEIPVVKDVGVAIVEDNDPEAATGWAVYLINMKDEPIEGVLVTSRGYGKINNEDRSSSILRHFLDTVEGKSSCRIEPISEEVFPLNNEYWVSFFQDGQMYDRKFVFLPETISKTNMTPVPVLDKKGVLIL